MPRWLASLLGLPEADGASGGRVLWLGGVAGAEPWMVAAGVLGFLLVVAAWTLFCYHREGRPGLPARLLLTLLRVAAVATLLVLLFEPAWQTRRVERNRSVVAVLVDGSDSMSLRDRWTDPAERRAVARWAGVSDPTVLPRREWAHRALGVQASTPSGDRTRPPERLDEWLRQLGRVHEVRLYAFGDDRRSLRTNGTQGPTGVRGDSTRLGDAIVTTLDEFAGQPLAGIVVLSDGGSNRGEDPLNAAGRAAERRVPVFTVGIGDPTPPRDLSVASLLVDDVIRKGDEVAVVVGLKHAEMAGRPVRVTLREDGKELSAQTVTLASAGQQELQFSYRPQRAGPHALQVAAVPQAGEVSRANNTRAARVRVVEKRLQVLYVEGSPRWEYRYLKNAILRDPNIKFACLLMDSEPSGGGEGNLKVPGFPTDRKRLFEYDIVILGDVARTDLTDSQLALLRAFVEERGGSLVLIAGEAHMPWEYRGTPLEALLPAVLPAGRRELTADEPLGMRLTDAGRRHPMLQLETDPAANARRWEGLPGSYWCGVMGRPKPGASVLLETDGPNEGEELASSPRRPVAPSLPLVLVQPVGEGMTLLSLLDSTWRWRYRLGDTYFYQYWGQVLRTMTPHELPGENRLAKLTVDRESYRPGERVVLRARVLTPAYHPLRAAALTAGVTRDDGTRHEVRLSPLGGSPGVYTAEWTPPRPGTYRVTLRAPTGGATAEAAFAVTGAPLELLEPEMNRDLLQRVAAASGGAYLELADLNRLPGRIPDRSERRVTRLERPLWDAPLPLAIFTFFLVGEWVLRKRSGLL